MAAWIVEPQEVGFLQVVKIKMANPVVALEILEYRGAVIKNFFSVLRQPEPLQFFIVFQAGGQASQQGVVSIQFPGKGLLHSLDAALNFVVRLPAHPHIGVEDGNEQQQYERGCYGNKDGFFDGFHLVDHLRSAGRIPG